MSSANTFSRLFLEEDKLRRYKLLLLVDLTVVRHKNNKLGQRCVPPRVKIWVSQQQSSFFVYYIRF